MSDSIDQLADLPVDDLTGTEQSHFDEFAQIEQQANELEPSQIPNLAENTPAEPTVSGAELIAPVIGLACSVLAPNWQIKPEEQQALAESYGAIADKYFPNGVSAFGVELNALLITAAILTPRLGQPRHEPKEQDNQEDESHAETSN
ncbi:hypothetical protein [Shewanella marina]|uniref:hypothetical protein n=1 Tax=Shewanella marina TaxID=487319 RepID=UPI0004729510|nr:hypothetical protein [Shewanella marina]